MEEIVYVMEDFIKTYDNVLDRQFCNTLIEKFEECESNQLSSSLRETGGRQFTEVRFGENMNVFKDEFAVCLNAFDRIVKQYKEDLSIGEIGLGKKQLMNSYWPKKYGMEGIKIKRYLDKEIDCVAGSALLFPPMWPWLHRGNKPIKKPKYLLQSYLHYMSPEALGEPSHWDHENAERYLLAGRKKEAIDKIHELHKKFPNSEKINQLMEQINGE